MEIHLQVLIPCNVSSQHWVVAEVDLQKGHINVYDPLRQLTRFAHRNIQFACLRYLLPSMLDAVNFHRNRRRGDKTYTRAEKPFRMMLVDAGRVPQQDKPYEYLKFSLTIGFNNIPL